MEELIDLTHFDSQKGRILFVSYAFPPSNAVGALRAKNYVKYLTKKGWRFTVVTPFRPKNILKRKIFSFFDREIEIVNLGIEKTKRPLFDKVIIKFLKFFGLSIDELWSLISLWQLNRKVNIKDFDIILVSGSPFISFIIMSFFSKKYEKPLVLDYRDLWSYSEINPYPFFLRKAFRWMERRILSRALHCFVVSETYMQIQANKFGDICKYHVVYNGYDPEEIRLIKPIKLGEFSIVYAGSFYPLQRDVDPLLKGLVRANRMLGEKNYGLIKLHYFGMEKKYLLNKVKKYKAAKFVMIHDFIDRRQILNILKGADLAVVIVSTRDRYNMFDKGTISGKIFEILGLGTPILLIGPTDGDAANIVRESRAGRCFSQDDIEGMSKWILEVYKNSRYLHYTPPYKYSWPYISKLVDAVLNEIVSKNF